jgi:hypothetical protein
MTIMSLWQPILVSAVVVFIAGSVIWMAMPWHRTDWNETEDEERVRDALRATEPGAYTVPHCTDRAEMQSPEFRQKLKEGPQAFITVIPSGEPQMGGKLLLMFVYNLLVGLFCAYLVSRTLAPEAGYMAIFRVAGTTAFIAYGMAYIQESIWFGRSWSMTAKTFLDALIYAGLTGGIFGWLA